MTRRIAMISEHASPLATLGGVDAGGQNVYVAQVARHLAAVGDRVDVFTRRDAPDQPEVVDFAPGVRVIHVPAGPPTTIAKEDLLEHMPAFTAWMVQRLRRSRPYDLVHANFFYSGQVAVDLKAALGLPFVITFHALGRVRRQFQGDADRFPDERMAIEDRIVAEAARIVAECPQDEEDLIRLYNAEPSRISIVPCGFDPAEFEPMSRPLARLDLGLDPAEPVLLQLGRMVPRKGVDTVIRAVARLRADHGTPVRLVIVGGPDREPDLDATPELARLAAIAEEEGVADLVQFVGRRDRAELKTFYNAADIFVSTPWYEPFGITPVEAMACGTPVVGSRVGGIKYSVRDGETGYLVAPNDPSALAERIAHLYRHPKLLSVFGRQAIHRANDLFTWERVANGVAAVYEEVLLEGRLARHDEAERLARVDRRFEEATETLVQTRRRSRTAILEAADELCRVLARDGKLLIAGNGGSAAEAQHWAAELVGRFLENGRPGLAAIALGTDPAIVTAWANDVGYADVFAREVEALGRPGDLLIGLSTTGRSPNLVRAFERARRLGIRTLALLGRDGGELRGLADHIVLVPSGSTQHIQEAHSVIVHVICELVEHRLVAAGWFAARTKDGAAADSGTGERGVDTVDTVDAPAAPELVRRASAGSGTAVADRARVGSVR
jgi:phosphoheptose isomerase/glycosyltransferase involved in cell wall biosynthesis